MLPGRQLSRAFGSVIAASRPGGFVGASAQIEEVIITAQKRAEDTQDTAVAMLAMDESKLDEQRIDTLEDCVRPLPSATAGGRDRARSRSASAARPWAPPTSPSQKRKGSAPNLVLNLDDKPVSAGGRDVDVQATDIARIEILPGPRETLYGASSQAGTVRERITTGP